MSSPVIEITSETQRDIRPSTQLCIGPGYYKNVRIDGKIVAPLIAWSNSACLSYKQGFIMADGQTKLRWDPDKQDMSVQESEVTGVYNSYPMPGPELEPKPEPEQVKKKMASVPKKKKKVVSTKKNAIPEAGPKVLKEKKKTTKVKKADTKKADK